MKKLVAMSAVLGVVIGTMAGCTNGEKTQETTKVTTGDAKKAETQKEDNTEQQKPTKLEWLAYNCYAQPDQDSDVVKLLEKELNIDFDIWYVDGERYGEIMGTRFASGDMPDIMRIRNSNVISSYVKQGILAPITEDFWDRMPTFKAVVEKYNNGSTEFLDCMVEGQQYAFKRPNLQGDNPTALVWRLDWLNNVNINKVPKTLEEFEEAAYAFKNNDPDCNGQQDTYALSNTGLSAIFGAFGPIPMKEFRSKGSQNLFYMLKDDQIAFACTQPEMKEALAVLQKWYKDGIIDPEFVTGENIAGYWATSQAFENSKVGVTGMAMPYHWMPKTIGVQKDGGCLEAFKAVNPGKEYGTDVIIGESIVGPEGASGTHKWGAYGIEAIGITSKAAQDSAKIEAIARTFEVLCADYELSELATSGIEGVHYEDNGDGTVTMLEPYTEQSEAIKAGLGVINSGLNEELVFNRNKIINGFMQEVKSTGYSDILVPPTEAADTYLEDLKTFTLKAYISMITGEKPVSYFDEFVEEFNKKGGQQIIDEINAAIR